MKIGIFTDCYYPQVNGVVTSVLMLEEELIKLGHEVIIVTVKVPNHIDDKDNIFRINSIPFSRWKEFRLGVPIFSEPFKQLKNMKFDVIHTHTEFSIGLLGKYMAKSLDIPALHTYHTMYEDYSHYVFNHKYGKNLIKKAIIRGSKLYVKQYDGIIAPTDKTKNALRRYGVGNNIFVVPTGINLRQFSKFNSNHPELIKLRKKYALSNDDKIILSLGRVSEEKSIQNIINQMPELIKEEPYVKLLIVGDGPYKNKLQKLCTKLNLNDHVIFTGQVPFDCVSYYYSLADVFVSASKTETQGLTIMEAMATGIPVVVYDDLNVKDVVIDGVSGRLFIKDTELTKSLINCFENEYKTKKLSKKATEIIANLSKESYAKKAEHVYYEILYNIHEFHKLKA